MAKNNTTLILVGVIVGAALYFMTKGKTCPPGFIKGANNQCIPFNPPPGGQCPPGTVWNDANGVCTPV